MTAREYLGDIERYRTRIGMLKAEIEAAYESMNLLPGVSYDGVNVQTATQDSRVLDTVAEVTDKIHRLAELVTEYEAAKAERIRMIDRLRDPEHIKVLYERYVSGLYFWEVARIMQTSESTVFRLHKAALAEMEGLIDG